MEISSQALLTSEGPSLGRGGKAIDSSNQNAPYLGKEKEKMLISSKSGFD